MSVDSFLGLPFNIASTAVLTRVLAAVTGLRPGEIVVNLGNTHIYNNHVEQVERQLKRTPFRFPTLEIKQELNSLEDIERLEFKDFDLKDYHSWPGIKAKMAV